MRRQVEIPEKLFHITRTELVPSILETGLMPGIEQTARYDDEGEDRLGTYLSSDWQTIAMIDGDFQRGKDYTVLEVDIAGVELIPDEAYDFGADTFTPEEIEEGLYDQFSWYTQQSIPPGRLRVVGKILWGAKPELEVV